MYRRRGGGQLIVSGSSPRVQPVQRGRPATYANFVGLGDTLSDADDQRDLGLDSLDDGVGSKRRGNIDDGRFRLELAVGLHVPAHSLSIWFTVWRVDGGARARGMQRWIETYLLDRAKDGQSEVLLAGLLGADTAEEPSAELERLLAVEGRLSSFVPGAKRRKRVSQSRNAGRSESSGPRLAASEPRRTVLPLLMRGAVPSAEGKQSNRQHATFVPTSTGEPWRI